MPLNARIEMIRSDGGTPPVPRTAIVYDFDGTLVKGNMQEHSFIPRIGMEPREFWKMVHGLTEAHDTDQILTYMHLMIEEARRSGEIVSEDQLREHGEGLPLFPGLEDGTWFDRINECARDLGLDMSHYVISSGIQEMIEGCSIFDKFRHVFASKFIYIDGEAKWPGVAINYTTKTQYLFRINKGIENHWDNTSINAYTPDHRRPGPFERMIFIGDGYTDIPTMKMLTQKEGHSIAVYDSGEIDAGADTIRGLIADDRVNFVAPADYGENSQLDIIVRGVIGRIKARCEGLLASAVSD